MFVSLNLLDKLPSTLFGLEPEKPTLDSVIWLCYIVERMNRRSIIITVLGFLIVGGMIAGWQFSSQNAQRGWPQKQLRNVSALGTALFKHRDKHGSYPVQLADLVDSGTMDQKDFAKLQFQSATNADPEQWLYRAPKQPSDIAIVSPKAVYPWSGHSGFIAIGRADGGAALTKRSQIPAWASK